MKPVPTVILSLFSDGDPSMAPPSIACTASQASRELEPRTKDADGLICAFGGIRDDLFR